MDKDKTLKMEREALMLVLETKLTEEQIWKCNRVLNENGEVVGGVHICLDHQNVVDFARAIEREIGFSKAKLKEKTMDEDDDTQVYKDDGNALLIAYQSGYYDGKKAALAGREQNFCERCGKRTADLTVIHTCTPPQENT